jgi:hypothetical protein
VNIVSLGEQNYNKAQALEILAADPGQDASLALAQQIIAARLNGESGADLWEIVGALSAANFWLQEHPPWSAPAGAIRNEGLALAAMLEDFNLGLTGPGACADELPTPAPTQPVATWTPTSTAPAGDTPTQPPISTATWTPTPTPEPTETPSPTETPEPTPTLDPSPTQAPILTDLPPTPTEAPTSAP